MSAGARCAVVPSWPSASAMTISTGTTTPAASASPRVRRPRRRGATAPASTVASLRQTSPIGGRSEAATGWRRPAGRARRSSHRLHRIRQRGVESVQRTGQPPAGAMQAHGQGARRAAERGRRLGGVQPLPGGEQQDLAVGRDAARPAPRTARCRGSRGSRPVPGAGDRSARRAPAGAARIAPGWPPRAGRSPAATAARPPGPRPAAARRRRTRRWSHRRPPSVPAAAPRRPARPRRG